MLKLTDFGLSEFFSLQNQKPFSDIAGSAFYVAPEVLRRKYGPAADLWSSGVIMYILLTGEVRSSRWRHHGRMHGAARSRAFLHAQDQQRSVTLPMHSTCLPSAMCSTETAPRSSVE